MLKPTLEEDKFKKYLMILFSFKHLYSDEDLTNIST